MPKSDKDLSKNQSRYTAEDSANSDSPGIGQVKEYLPGLSIVPKNRQGLKNDPSDDTHTYTHRAPGDE